MKRGVWADRREPRGAAGRPAKRAALIRAAVGLAAVLAASPTPAAQCTLNTTGLRFGVLNPYTAAHATVAGTLVLTCRGKIGETVHYRVQVMPDEGVAQRRSMRAGIGTLTYNLYLDPGTTRIWGDGNGGTGEIAGTLQLPDPVYSRLVPVYARLLSAGPAEATPYVDHVVVQLTY